MFRLHYILKQSKPSMLLSRSHLNGYNSANICALARPRFLFCAKSVAANGASLQQCQLSQLDHMVWPSKVNTIGLVNTDIRTFSSSTQNAVNNQQTAKIRSWAFELDNTFGKIVSNTSFPMRVVPLNPIEFPSADRIFVHLLLRSPISGDNMSDFIKHTFQKSCSTDVSLSPDQVLAIEGDFLDIEQALDFEIKSHILGWYVEIPMRFDLHLKSTGLGHVYVEKFENKSCDFETEQGDCIMKSLKTSQATASTQGGNIVIMKSLLGNVSLTAKAKGKIKTDKIQGQVVKLTSEEGQITCSDIYANATTIQTEGGDIITRNLHGGCNVRSNTGNIQIGSLDGSLYSEVTSGSVDVYAIRHKDIYINNSEGDVVVKVPNELKTHLNLEARGITLPDAPPFADCTREQIGEIMKVEGVISQHAKENRIHVKANNGNVKIKTLSWFDSLSFQKIMKEV